MKRRYKMYGIVCDNISSLQKGIQFSKSVVEYSIKYGEKEPYKIWSEGDKSITIYNGGSTNSRRFDGKYIGIINRYLDELNKNGIESVSFYEKNMGDQLTSVCLLVDDRVWDNEKFNDYDGPWRNKMKNEPFQIPYDKWRSKFGKDEEEIKKIFFLRKFFNKLRII